MTVTFIDTGGVLDATTGTDGPVVGVPLPTVNTSASNAIEPPQQIYRNSIIMPAPGPEALSRPLPAATYAPTSTIRAAVGRFRVIIDGVDVTYFRGVATQVEEFFSVDPGGDGGASLYFPQITWYDRPGHGDLYWYHVGTIVQIKLGATRVFVGILGPESFATTTLGRRLEAFGLLFQTDFSVWRPPLYIKEYDLGEAVAKVFNGVVSRKYNAMAKPDTGIMVFQRGSFGSRTDWWQSLISTGWLRDGTTKWTITNTGFVPKMYLRDITTKHHTVSLGTPGIDFDIAQDMTQFPNVIYGEGTGPEGYHWRNTKYPNLSPGNVPLFPGSGSIDPGESAANFEDFANEMERKGYSMHINGNLYDPRDEDEVRNFQDDAGISVTGGVNAQTWATLFQPAANGADLSAPFYQWLARWSTVEPYLYTGDGDKLGPNPTYDGGRSLRIEAYHNYGEGITKKKGRDFAKAEVAPWYTWEPGWTGTINLKSDPEGGSRFFMRAGENVFVRYMTPPLKHFYAYSGVVTPEDGCLLHISEVHHSLDQTTLTVSYRPVDLTSLNAIRERRREMTDPGRLGKVLRRRGKQTRDEIVVFDGDSGAGIIPKHKLTGGLWTVIRVPVGQIGSIVKTEFHAKDPDSKFAIGFFGRPVTADDLRTLVGNPLVLPAVSGHRTPWSVESEKLLDLGMLVAMGGPSNACGYYPGTEADLGGITGDHKDLATWEYESIHPPWLWLAEWCPNDTTMHGRIFASPEL